MGLASVGGEGLGMVPEGLDVGHTGLPAAGWVEAASGLPVGEDTHSAYERSHGGPRSSDLGQCGALRDTAVIGIHGTPRLGDLVPGMARLGFLCWQN